MSDAGDSDAQQDNAALLLWSLGAWHRQQQRYREWLASNRRKEQHLRAISKTHAGQQLYQTVSSIDSSDLGTSSYGLLLQLREASSESEGCVSFIRKSVDIIANTLMVTFVLAALLTLPLGMIVVGLKHLDDCPIQPKIPIYLLVGGCFGLLKLLSLLLNQVRARRYEQLNVSIDSAPGTVSSLISSQFIDILLSIFLFIWFICGNYWVLSVWPPNYRQTLSEPNSWCDKTAYVLALVQLCVCYGLMLIIALFTGLLILCQRVWTSQM